MMPHPQVEGVPLCTTLRTLIDKFTERMHSINSNGVSIATDTAVLTLHQDLTAMNIQLLKLTDDTQDKKGALFN